jgi:hypothetical protein
VVGFSSILVNLGEVENKGTEITINTVNIEKKNFTWKTSFGIWWNQNTINHLYGATPNYDATGKVIGYSEKDDLTNNWYIGHDINAVYNYKVIGVWQRWFGSSKKKPGFIKGSGLVVIFVMFKLVAELGRMIEKFIPKKELSNG